MGWSAMAYGRPPEIEALEAALEANRQEASAVAQGLSAEQGAWRATPDSWSVAQCLDHLATGNRVYVAAMRPPAERARARGRLRRRPATPGWLGGWFVRSLEPPVRPLRKLKAPRLIRPSTSPALDESHAAFLRWHDEAVAFLLEHADLDLAGILFPNPFIKGLRFSLATGLNVIAAHERRHLWQARCTRRAAEIAQPRGERAERDSSNLRSR
jgi:hypothetical protein